MPKPNFKIDELMLVLIVAAISMIAVVYDKTGTKETEAEKITNMILDNHGISFASNGVVNENKLREIQKMDYGDFKRYFDVKNDFCIYIEDENGGIILAKGSEKLNGDGIPCRG